MAHAFEHDRLAWVYPVGMCALDSLDVTEDGKELFAWVTDVCGRELLWSWSPCRPPGQQQRISVICG